MPLRLSHVSLKEPDGRVRVVMSVAIGRGVTRPEAVKIGYVLYDATGRVTGHAVEAKELQPVGPAEEASLSFMEAMTVQPGDYIVKFAAMDAKGRIGSVFHNIDARLTAAGGVSTSDLLLVDPARRADTGVMLPIADGRVVGLSLGAYLEVYGDAARPRLGVAVEIADRPNGKALVGATLPVGVREAGARWSAEGVLDLSLLPPGQYVASAVVTDGETRLAVGHAAVPARAPGGRRGAQCRPSRPAPGSRRCRAGCSCAGSPGAMRFQGGPRLLPRTAAGRRSVGCGGRGGRSRDGYQGRAHSTRRRRRCAR